MNKKEVKQPLALGIELGSTRIKAVAIDNNYQPFSSGSYTWSPDYRNGVWTYPLSQVWEGVREAFSEIDHRNRITSMGISGMMHGYLAFDRDWNLLVPFRTWQNTITAQTAAELTKACGFNIPQRWSIAHLYQAVLNKEEHVTKTHLELYRAFPEIGGIAHTHSVNAVAFAQAGMDIPALGTTHADYFYGSVFCTRELTEEEANTDYETNTGKVIVECIQGHGVKVMDIPGVLVKNHGPFTWGKDAADSVCHAVILETISEMSIKTLFLNPNAGISQYVLDKHYFRKHGANAYYGQ